MDKYQVRSNFENNGIIKYKNDIGDLHASFYIDMTGASDGDVLTYSSGVVFWDTGGGGSGTVTSVSIVTNDGVSGTVANATTTPAITLELGTITPTAVDIFGTGGNGYLHLPAQSTGVPTPINGLSLWADSINRFGWRNPVGYAVSFDDTGLTASRNYILPNAGGTLALLTDITTGYVPYTGATADVDLDTYMLNAKALHVKGTGGAGHLGLKHQSADATASTSETALYADSNGDLKYKNDGNYRTTLKTSLNTADRVYTFQDVSGTLALTNQLPTPSALTKTDDTNVTLTLGGSPSTALLQAASLTLGWTGQLAISRGGTGGNLYAGLDLITTATASSSATIDFTGLSSTYSKYVIVLNGVYPATNNTSFLLRVGTGGTPTYQTGATDYEWVRQFATGSSVGTSRSVGDSSILIGSNGTQSNSSTRTVNGTIEIINPSQTNDWHNIIYSLGYRDSSGTDVIQTGYGHYVQTTAVTAIRLFMASGNITGGTIKLYGVR